MNPRSFQIIVDRGDVDAHVGRFGWERGQPTSGAAKYGDEGGSAPRAARPQNRRTTASAEPPVASIGSRP